MRHFTAPLPGFIIAPLWDSYVVQTSTCLVSSKVSPQQAILRISLDFSSHSNACVIWNPRSDKILRSISVRAIIGYNYSHFRLLREHDSLSLLAPSTVLPRSSPSNDSSVSTTGSLVPASPTYLCAGPHCTACFLDSAYAEVRMLQPPLEATTYQHNDVCEACDQGGTLVFCDYCNVVYHHSCVPAMQPHQPLRGFVCVDCYR